MSRKYKFHNPEGIYFVSFAIVYWIDVFVREIYYETFVKSLEFCRKNKGLELFAYCIMPSHVHFIFRDNNNNPSKLIKEIKTHTSKSPRWCELAARTPAEKNSNVKNRQFWQQHNKPIELWSNKVIEQKLDYVHNNPIEAGFVTEPHHWKYSSAKNYADEIGEIEIDFL
jgi:putative transposase